MRPQQPRPLTTRHHGGGHKQHYRVIDFKRDKDGVVAKVERLEHDPNRSANIALLCYADGERRYIIAPKGVSAGMQLQSGPDAPIKAATRCRSEYSGRHHIPLRRDDAGQGRAARAGCGASVQLLAREGDYAQLRLRSGEIRKVHVNCRARSGRRQ